MKKLLSCMLLIFLGCSTFAQSSDVRQLDEQMKSFRNRVRVYIKCLTGKCTTQERNAAARAALKDGAIVAGTLALVGLTIGVGFGGRWLYSKKEKKDILTRLSNISGNGGIGSILMAVEDAMKIALLGVDPNKKLMVQAMSTGSGLKVTNQEEDPTMECQTQVDYVIGDHGTLITLKRCDNQINVDVIKVGTLKPAGVMVLLNDWYKELGVYKSIIPFIERLKSDHNIDRISIRVPLEDEQGNKVTKEIEL